jgi:hypothetical protein
MYPYETCPLHGAKNHDPAYKAFQTDDEMGRKIMFGKEMLVMRTVAVFLLILFSMVVSAQSSRPDADKWDLAEQAIKRLSPDAFPELPFEVQAYLQKHGYKIPQCYDCRSDPVLNQKPNNVISGHFLGLKSMDWAVLGSRNHKSRILVFPHGTADGVISKEQGEDKNWLQGANDEKIGYSRLILVADKENILAQFAEYGGPKPPPIDHQGIDSVFAGKGSSVLYYYKGKWLTLTGAD